MMPVMPGWFGYRVASWQGYLYRNTTVDAKVFQGLRNQIRCITKSKVVTTITTMALTDDDINEFMRLYREEFGEILSFGNASTRAEEVIMLLAMLAEDEEVRTETSQNDENPLDDNLR